MGAVVNGTFGSRNALNYFEESNGDRKKVVRPIGFAYFGVGGGSSSL